MPTSSMYHDGNRRMQDAFGSRAMADRLEQSRARVSFNDADRQFIENAIYFFLATADAEGRPDCSFKGGAAGFVRVTGSDELAFPDYDGNGMFKSIGNILVNPSVGLLFIRLHDKPHRLRVNGTASVQLPALHPEDAAGRTLQIRPSAGMRPHRAGLDGPVQRRQASAAIHLEG
jgi:uncharacterized protein